MKMTDGKGGLVPPELKAISRALERTGRFTARMGPKVISLREHSVDGDFVYTVRAGRAEKAVFWNTDEAYIRFRFLVEAYFQESLPPL